ncbi:adck1 [Symbiodinium natans]|uniref:Adck1 protein n=1 Tax=Symbiodinium natans TaxID=878477 RepID=A0A812KHA2_9DINO|nr:adck1 [Symbiodinium natans]
MRFAWAQKASKVALRASLVSCGGLALACVHEDTRRSTLETLLSCRRALHAAICVGNMAVRYKALSWRHGAEPQDTYSNLLSKTHGDCAHLALQMCRGNGGLFVKIGQHAATLAPAVPPEYVQHLSLLQDRAPAGDWEDVKMVICSELGVELGADPASKDGVFREFDVDPVGSASLAQVHRAKLRDGSEVAVKVQHRHIESVVASDIFIVRFLERLMSHVFRQEGFSMAWAIDEFERNVQHELDFREEAKHAERCRDFFANSDLAACICVPKVHPDYSTRRMLVMDFSHGTAISKVVKSAQRKSRGLLLSAREEVEAQAAKIAARLLIEAFGTMVFSFGYVHCDPHPGNLLVEMGKGDKGPRLVILDHGLYRELSEDRRLANCGLWKAMALQDAAELVKSCNALGIDACTAELLPLYFTNRSIETKAGLGQKITAEQKSELKLKLQRLGILPEKASAASFAISGLGMLADRVPGDMLMVMRTMHLVASLHRDLGGRSADRFASYAVAAARGNESKDCNCWRLSRLSRLSRLRVFVKTLAFKARLWLRELRLRLHGTLSGAQEEFSIARSLAEIARDQR